ncbi:MAG: YetF domain-containing protein [Cellvibrionaceae bacterium]
MDMIFFDSWSVLIRTTIIGVLAYVALVMLLRVSGRRTLSKMNAFDLVVTVALGSTLATVLLNQEVTLAQGTLAFALLIGMQFAVTWLSVRVGWVRKLTTGEPALLLHRGAMLRAAMRKSRVTEEELHSALRSAGVARIEDARAVVLETDGSFSVIHSDKQIGEPVLKGVKIPTESG